MLLLFYFSLNECLKDSVPVPLTVFSTTINKTLNREFFCGRMWRNIPVVQLHGSSIYAKARLSSSGGLQWPRAQPRHSLLMFPRSGCSSLQPSLTSALISCHPALCLPHGRMIWEGAYLCVCVFICIFMYVCVCVCVCFSHFAVGWCRCMCKQPVGEHENA